MKEDFDYKAVHIENGQFLLKLNNGETKIAGHNIKGMIRFTYFENYEMPPIGWSVSREQLIKDYTAKLVSKLSA